MDDDKVNPVVLEALRQGMGESGEQRLYRSGKLGGLFAGRTGLAGEAAGRALRDGLIEVIRTETRGKTTVEWARVTPRGVDFLLQHESPVRAMDDLRAALQLTRDGIPAWVAEIRQNLRELSDRLVENVHHLTHRLEILSEQVAQALARVESQAPKLPPGTAEAIPWSQDALSYLDRRREGGLLDPCPMSELFSSLRAKHANLTVQEFHSGLRRLHDRGVFRLLPFEGPQELPEPEYALLDGAQVYYFVAR